MPFFKKTDKGYVLRVRLTPNSSCVKINGVFKDAEGNDYLKINVVSVPEKGKANKEMISFLSRLIKTPQSAFEITGGQTDRYKKITITTHENLDLILENMTL